MKKRNINHFLKLFQDDENYIDYFCSFADEQLRLDPKLVHEVLEKALVIAQKNGFVRGEAWALGYIGWYYHDCGQFERANKCHSRAHELFEEIMDEKGIVFACNGIMSNYSSLGMYDISIEWGIQGLEIAEKIGDERRIISFLINLAISYLYIGFFKEAKATYEHIKYLNYPMSTEMRIIALHIISEAELNLHEYFQSLHHVNESIRLSRELGSQLLEAESLRIRAELYVLTGEYDKGEQDFKAGLKIATEAGSKTIVTSILLKWAENFKGATDDTKPIEMLLQAHDLGVEMNAKHSLVDIEGALSKQYKLKGDFEKALYYLESSNEKGHEIYNEKNRMMLSKIQESQSKREALVYRSLYDQVELISTIGQKITSDLHVENIIDTIFHQAKKLMKLDAFGLSFYKEEKEALQFSLFMENDIPVQLPERSIYDSSSLGAYCVRNKEDICINDIDVEYKKYISKLVYHKITDKQMKSVLYSPLIVEDNVVGYVTVQSYSKHAYSPMDVQTFKALSSYIAIALHNAMLYEQMTKQATHDSLTGLWNRGQILMVGESRFQECQKHKDDLSIILLDIDFFKEVNDTYGHMTGDYAIFRVAQVLQEVVGTEGVLGRYGGEEFLVVLAGYNDEKARQMAERIRAGVEAVTIELKGKEPIHLTVSVGVYHYDEHATSFEKGISYADQYLYHAKGQGRNRVCFV